jgi:hypothetical protein
MTWLMRGAAAVTCAALITGLATLPSLRTMIVHQHPGSSSGAIDSAVNIAAVIIGIRALAGIGPWLWAARYAARRRRHTGIVTVVALVVSSLGIASSSPQALSTFPVRLLSLVGWLLGLGAVALFWARHVAVAPVGNGGRTPRTVSARKAWTAMVKEAWAASVRKAWPPAFPRQNRKNPWRRRKPPSRAAKRSVLPGGVIGTVVGQRNQPRRSALKPMKAQRVPPTRLTGEETDGTGDARRG